jgi:hypothetical protein
MQEYVIECGRLQFGQVECDGDVLARKPTLTLDDKTIQGPKDPRRK